MEKNKLIPKRTAKEARRDRDSFSINDPEWLHYNAELRFIESYNSGPESVDTMIWRHIYYHSMKMFNKAHKSLNPAWKIAPTPKPYPNLTEITSAILINRGITENVTQFIEAPLENLSMKMNSLEESTSLIRRALAKKIPVTVYGDYDADGITGTVLAVEALSRLGAKVDYYINSRPKGYAVDEQGIKEIAARGTPRLLITVDNGISSHDAIALACKKKMAVIVTDHHEITTKPKAHVIVHPEKFNTPLSGVGTIFKVICHLYESLNRKDAYDFLDLVAIGTIADVVPLIGENRILAKHGLKNNKRPAVQALMQTMSINKFDSQAVAFKIAPVLNASSRINGTSDPAVDLLMEKDYKKALSIAEYLVKVNEKRKSIVDEQYKKAEKMVDLSEKVIIVHSDFHEGVAGIIASRLKDNYFRPAIVLCESDKYLKGSCRSIKEFNIKKALDKCDLTRYGGHAMAAGLVLEKERFASFRKAILTEASKVIFPPPEIMIDAELEKVDVDLITELNSLEPYGESFPSPVFLTKCSVKDFKEIGNGHLKISDDIEYIIWNAFADISEGETLLLLGLPSVNEFNNKLQFIAWDYRKEQLI